MKFSEQDVRNAYFARRTDEDARAQGWTPEETIKSLAGSFENSDRLIKTEIKRYQQGKKILKKARLILGTRKMAGTAGSDLYDLDSPMVSVSAGHIATTEAIRYIGLRTT